MRICVFCGSSTGRGERYVHAARELGCLLARRGIGVVYGGAQAGTMGALADATLAAGGEVVGVMPGHLVDRERAHPGLADLHVVDSMHERKARMAELADAFIALPGGAGTLDELIEVWTWSLLGLHDDPIGLLDVAGYFGPLLAWVDHMVTERFVDAASRDVLLVASDATELVERLLDRRSTHRR